MTGAKLNRETGHYEVHAPFKAAVWLGGLLLSLSVGVATYSITITLAYGQVKQDIALLRQEITLRTMVSDARIEKLEAGRSALDALAAAVKANTDALRQLSMTGVR